MRSIINKTTLKAGLLVGTLDICSAFLHFYIKTGRNPLLVLKYISSAVLGKQASAGGYEIMALGLLFHYIIAFSFTLFFFWLVTKIPALLGNWVLTGMIYGLFIWSFMQFIVLPLTRLNPLPLTTERILIGASILIVCIGLPLAFIARRRKPA